MVRFFLISLMVVVLPSLVAGAQEDLPRADVRPGPEAGPNEMPSLVEPDALERPRKTIRVCTPDEEAKRPENAEYDVIGRAWGADIINPVLRERSDRMIVCTQPPEPSDPAAEQARN